MKTQSSISIILLFIVIILTNLNVFGQQNFQLNEQIRKNILPIKIIDKCNFMVELPDKRQITINSSCDSNAKQKSTCSVSGESKKLPLDFYIHSDYLSSAYYLTLGCESVLAIESYVYGGLGTGNIINTTLICFENGQLNKVISFNSHIGGVNLINVYDKNNVIIYIFDTEIYNNEEYYVVSEFKLTHDFKLISLNAAKRCYIGAGLMQVKGECPDYIPLKIPFVISPY